MKRIIHIIAISSLFFLLIIGVSSLLLIPSSCRKEKDEKSDDSAKAVETVTITPPPLDEPRTFTGHSWFVSSVAFSPDGRYALSTGEDGTLKLWNLGLS